MSNDSIKHRKEEKGDREKRVMIASELDEN
jgi:hypothetical protein